MGEDAEPGLLEHGLVDVGRVDPDPVGEALLGEQDRQRVDLLAGGAAGDPEPRERIRVQHRHHPLAEGEEEARVAEHGGHVDREVEQQPLHHRRVVQEQVLQSRDRLHLLAFHPPAHAPPQRGRRVLAEVEAVAAVDSFEQELDLDPLELELLASIYW